MAVSARGVAEAHRRRHHLLLLLRSLVRFAHLIKLLLSLLGHPTKALVLLAAFDLQFLVELLLCAGWIENPTRINDIRVHGIVRVLALHRRVS